MRSPGFPAVFEALTGHRPFPWQIRLFNTLCCGDVPSFCDLPTGLGKTAVIPVWIAALACSAEERPLRLPRRLAYVVNRRTVVDQATDVVAQIRERLRNPGSPGWGAHAGTLRWIAERLRGLAAFPGEPLAVSTLRGELADNGEWKADPARPAVIIGTIDMIGSRLLFSGYGDGRYRRPHHAGLLGQDTLIVHDETHLVPAFDELLRAVEDCQRRDRDPRPVRVLSMSATPLQGRRAGSVIGLGADDMQHPEVQRRIHAKKTLYLHRVGAGEEMIQKIADLALLHKDANEKIIVYVTSPSDAQKVKKILDKSLGKASANRTALLTGTIRGHERDELVRCSAVYRALLDHKTRPKATVFLVSTSAGEVGNDFDADHMVCDGTPLGSLVQRLGRVNRRGARQSRVDIVYADGTGRKKKKKGDGHNPALATAVFLSGKGASPTSGIDAGPAAMRELIKGMTDGEKALCFGRSPRSVPATDVLFDLWALTSVPGNGLGRPDISEFLYGIEPDLPDTTVAWRTEITLLHRANVDEDALGRWFRLCRIEARERLRANTSEVASALKKLVESRKQDFRVAVLDGRGGARWVDLSKLDDDQYPLDYKTVVLPVEAGGLDENGMMDPGHADPARDVADNGNARARWLKVTLDGEERYLRLTSELYRQLIGSATSPQGMASWVFEQNSAVSVLDSKNRVLATVALVEPPEDDSGMSLDLIASTNAPQNADADPETLSTGTVVLADHARAVTTCATRIAAALGLDPAQWQALVLAAEHHDIGKAAPIWQRYARANPTSLPIAKSDRYLHPSALGGYRHEAGSLVDCLAPKDGHRVELPDLALHLIAAHHGWARPHFDEGAWASITSVTSRRLDGEIVPGVVRRFGQIQRRFGRWGLAWLETLLRCADAEGSLGTPNAVQEEGWDGTPSAAAAQADRLSEPAQGRGLPQPPELTVQVNILNPGEYFACCGLLELVHRLLPDVEGRFTNDDSAFTITFVANQGGTGLSLDDVVRTVVDCGIQRLEGGRLQLSDPFNLVLDWWLQDKNKGKHKGKNKNPVPGLKTWSGKQDPLLIAQALQHTLRGWGAATELFGFSSVNKVETFYFDSTRFTSSLDAGFSYNEVGMEAECHPAVELLAFIGLQRFHPIRANQNSRHRVFRYWTWHTPVPVSVAPAAAAGIVLLGTGYEFIRRPREGDGLYGGFGTAHRI